MTSAQGQLNVHLPGGVKIPPALGGALEQGNLVLFVGAGASLDPGSSLPSFEGLTKELLTLAGSDDAPANDKRYDVQLGDLADTGFDVHRGVREIVGNPQSKPNRWHKAIARLFETQDQSRIVTTNYDLHLESALGASADVWQAPALPLGYSFSGIVHLHGSLDGPDEGLTITDREFGRAYLTEGWARRFIVSVFEHYHVLFVGYSHDDLVMQYLARGLPPESAEARFALVSPQDDTKKWIRLRITPIVWGVDASDPYGPGVRALSEWGHRTWWSDLQHTHHIERLSTGGPLLDPVEGSYLARVLEHPTRVRIFCRSTSSEDWLQWVADKPVFRELFDPGATLSDAQAVLAQWLAEKYVVTSVASPMDLLADQGGRLSPGLWRAIAYAIWRSGARGPGTFESWLTVLCDQDPGVDTTVLGYLLNSCSLPTDRTGLLILLRHLLEPRVGIRPGISYPGRLPRVAVSIDVRADAHWMEKAFDDILIPNINSIASDAYEVATSVLTRYHDIFLALGQVFGGHDPISHMRSAIEPHSQNRFDPPIMFAVDLAREAAKALARDRGTFSVAEDLQRRNVPILQRLAAWVVATG